MNIVLFRSKSNYLNDDRTHVDSGQYCFKTKSCYLELKLFIL